MVRCENNVHAAGRLYVRPVRAVHRNRSSVGRQRDRYRRDRSHAESHRCRSHVWPRGGAPVGRTSPHRVPTRVGCGKACYRSVCPSPRTLTLSRPIVRGNNKHRNFTRSLEPDAGASEHKYTASSFSLRGNQLTRQRREIARCRHNGFAGLPWRSRVQVGVPAMGRWATEGRLR